MYVSYAISLDSQCVKLNRTLVELALKTRTVLSDSSNACRVEFEALPFSFSHQTSQRIIPQGIGVTPLIPHTSIHFFLHHGPWQSARFGP